ncbi:MAG: hypothetical protein OXC53_01420 [Rhodobacteraceae bacterium]|nr:hypothetical protein [Paracoccaceae bacterium]
MTDSTQATTASTRMSPRNLSADPEANPFYPGAWPLADGYSLADDPLPDADYLWESVPPRPHPDSVHVNIALASLGFPEQLDELFAPEIWWREFHHHRFYGMLNAPRLFRLFRTDDDIPVVGPVFEESIAARCVYIAPRTVVDGLPDRLAAWWDADRYRPDIPAHLGAGGAGFVSARPPRTAERPPQDLRFFARDTLQFMEVAHVKGPADFTESHDWSQSF